YKELRGLSVGVWGSGVNPDAFDPANYDRERERKRWGFGREKIFLYHGAMSSRGRGLVEAAASFRSANLKDAVLVFVGKGELEEAIVRAGGPSVRIMPAVPYGDVPSLLSASDFVVIPFLRTPVIDTSCPIKLLEALAMEKPIVATDVPPIRELLEGKPFWFRADTPRDLVRAFAEAARAEKVDTSGARSIAMAYSFDEQAKRLLDFVSRL
ncbi:MAG: glycosyltransferase, partial [Candidatus Hydrothermia bacterium]